MKYALMARKQVFAVTSLIYANLPEQAIDNQKKHQTFPYHELHAQNNYASVLNKWQVYFPLNGSRHRAIMSNNCYVNTFACLRCHAAFETPQTLKR